MAARPRGASRARRTVSRAAAVTFVCVGAAVGAGIGVAFAATTPHPDDAPRAAKQSSPTASAATQPTRPPTKSPDEQLLAASGVADGCVVKFTGDGIGDAPEVETAGQRYLHLPIPAAEGRVFAGWYATPAAAAALDVANRINGADVVGCDEQRVVTLHAAWMTPDQLAADPAQVPILMYHQFTDKPEGEEGWLKLNFYDIGAWRQDMQYIHDGGFYLPTWDELSAFIDGRLWLPKRSVIVTDDDADPTWLNMAVPVVNEFQVLSTSFVITKYRSEPTPSMWVQQRSHTNDMHEAGDNGKGRIVNWPLDQITADLTTSAQILGAKEVIAYPYGHYNDTAKQGVAAAGFDMAVTTEYGYATVGSDKLALPRVRMNWGMTVDDLKTAIG